MKKKLVITAIILAIVLIGGAALYFFVIHSAVMKSTYREAVDLWNENEHMDSAIIFSTIADYEDSRTYLDRFSDEIVADLTGSYWKTDRMTATDTVQILYYAKFLEGQLIKAGYYGKVHSAKDKDYPYEIVPYSIVYEDGKAYLHFVCTDENDGNVYTYNYEIVYEDGRVEAFVRESKIFNGDIPVFYYVSGNRAYDGPTPTEAPDPQD